MKKKLAVVLIVILLLILLVPVPIYLKDGGTVVYQAVLYKVSKVHRLNDLNAEKMYSEGWEVEILGIEIYENVK